MKTNARRKGSLLLIPLLLLMLFVTMASVMPIKAKASEEPALEIISYNVSYSNSVYILYAVKGTGFDTSKHEIKMLFWNETQESYTKETADYTSKYAGTATIHGDDCYIFYSNGLAAKEMTEDVYSRAYVKINDREYYSETVKFSVLEYVYAMKESGNLSGNLSALYDKMLDYGSAAQENFGHKTDRLANDTYYNVITHDGHLSDGFKHGRYKQGDIVTIHADKPKAGMRFSHWEDENGITVSYDEEFEVEIGKHSKKYKAIFKDVTSIATQLKLTSTIAYNGTLRDAELPDAVSFEDKNEKKVVLEVEWDTESFVPATVGKQTLYASLKDASAYEKYGIEPGSIVMEITVLPYSFVLDTASGEYVLTGYVGNESEITIPASYRNAVVSKISENAFDGCTALKSVVIPQTVTKIEKGAFRACDSIESITVPFIGEAADSENNYFGWIFDAINHEVQQGFVPAALHTVTISDGLTVVPENAFYGCRQLTAIYLPDSTERIEKNAFYLTSLAEFYIPASLSYYNNGLLGCTPKKVHVGSLEQLFRIEAPIPGINEGTVPTLLNGADLYCNGELIAEITYPAKATLTTLLHGCTSIRKITVPAGVTAIEPYAFAYMTALEEVVFEDPAKITDLGRWAFAHTTFKQMDLRAFTALSEIPLCTFLFCSELQTVLLPEQLEFIGEDAFALSGITHITLPESVQAIGARAFNNCELTQIDIPDSVVLISDSAFSYCDALQTVRLPSKLKIIGNRAFSSCTALTAIELPEGVTGIGQSSFSHCSSLTFVDFPTTLETIGRQAFYSCYSLCRVSILSDKLTEIEDAAFENCPILYEIYNLSDLALEIGSDEYGKIAFNARAIHADARTESNIRIDENGFITYADESSAYLIGYTGNGGVLVLPENVDGKAYSIVSGAFRHIKYNALYQLTIPAGVKSIATDAFDLYTVIFELINRSSLSNSGYGFRAVNVRSGAEAEALYTIVIEGNFAYAIKDNERILIDYFGKETDITVPAGVTAIGDYAFYYSGYSGYIVKNVNIPEGVTSIGDYAFYYASGLESIVIPESVTSIGTYAFYNCTKLKSIQLPEEMTELGDNAFQGCKALQSITLPKELTQIGWRQFQGCASLTSVTIPQGVTRIWGYAFYGCTHLQSIVIPESVVKIDNYAFSGCNMLKNVYYEADADAWENITIQTTQNQPLFDASIFYYLESTALDAGNYWHYDADGKIVHTCKDTDKDHICDICEQRAACVDTNDHKCDICDAILSLECSDENKNHLCDLCQKILSECTDENKNHVCDYCGIVSDCYDEGFDFICDLCQKDLASQGLSFTKLSDGSYAVSGIGSCTDKIVCIPMTYNGAAVTAISNTLTSYSMVKICIPKSISSISPYSFNNASSLQAIEVDPQNPYFTSVDGVLYNKGMTKLLRFPIAKSAEHFVIPATVTSWNSSAFNHCNKLKGIEICEGVTSIGGGFDNCYSLQYVKISASVTAITRSAFWRCSALSFEVDSQNTAFASLDGSLYNKAFTELIHYATGKSDSSFIIPDTVTIIGSYAFDGAKNLTSVTIHADVTSIGTYAFRGCSALASIAIPEGITKIESSTFYNCDKLEEIVIPKSMKKINSAFSGCNMLAHVLFAGTKSEWQSITITASNNTSLLNANIHYYSESTSFEAGYYWHYDADGKITHTCVDSDKNQICDNCKKELES